MAGLDEIIIYLFSIILCTAKQTRLHCLYRTDEALNCNTICPQTKENRWNCQA